MFTLPVKRQLCNELRMSRHLQELPEHLLDAMVIRVESAISIIDRDQLSR